jgi:hypothetical protein
MNNALTTRFSPFLDEPSLRFAIELICAEFGRVTYLNILPASRRSKLSCACFLRLDSPTAEKKLKLKLDVIEQAGYLRFDADVDEKWTGPTLRPQ